jgi:hypothetical protein
MHFVSLPDLRIQHSLGVARAFAGEREHQNADRVLRTGNTARRAGARSTWMRAGALESRVLERRGCGQPGGLALSGGPELRGDFPARGTTTDHRNQMQYSRIPALLCSGTIYEVWQDLEHNFHTTRHAGIHCLPWTNAGRPGSVELGGSCSEGRTPARRTPAGRDLAVPHRCRSPGDSRRGRVRACTPGKSRLRGSQADGVRQGPSPCAGRT